jgi:ribosome-associated translation inhibitor RaiA
MGSTDFHIDFDSQVPEFTAEMREAAQERLQGLAEEYSDLTGAAIKVTQPIQGEEPFRFQADVVVYAHPEDLTATQEDYSVVAALNGALAGIERQIHEEYEKQDEPWTDNNLLDTGT